MQRKHLEQQNAMLHVWEETHVQLDNETLNGL